MKAEITFSELWRTPSLRKFFFRNQSEGTLQELLFRAPETEKALQAVEDYAEVNFKTLDDIEEMFYEESVSYLAQEFGIEIGEDEEEEEEE